MYKAASALVKEKAAVTVIVKYYPFCFINKLLNLRSRIFVDIRSGSLYENRIRRGLANSLITLEALFFDRVLVLSESLFKRLRLPPSKTSVVPLGGRLTDYGKKSYETINLLYIGVLTNRRIEDTISGVRIYLEKREKRVTYDIVGYGTVKEEEKIRRLIKEFSLDGIVKFHGRVYGNDLRRFYEKCNVGVVYIPVTQGYNVQPATKSYEYLLGGLAVIATGTEENKSLINERTGILINDDAASFSNALKKIASGEATFNSDEIRASATKHDWENIINTMLRPLLVRNENISY